MQHKCPMRPRCQCPRRSTEREACRVQQPAVRRDLGTMGPIKGGKEDNPGTALHQRQEMGIPPGCTCLVSLRVWRGPWPAGGWGKGGLLPSRGGRQGEAPLAPLEATTALWLLFLRPPQADLPLTTQALPNTGQQRVSSLPRPNRLQKTPVLLWFECNLSCWNSRRSLTSKVSYIMDEAGET